MRGLLDLPWEAVLVGLGLFAILTAFVAADPTSRATASFAPFTDEAFNLANARNFVQLGHWSTDEWNLYLVNLPFSLIEAAWLKLVGVGIVQARLVSIVCVSLTAAALVWGMRGIAGRAAATFCGIAFAASGLILFYGRLAFLEDFVVLWMTLGTLVLAGRNGPGLRSGAISGLFYAVAIGTKPNALFPIVGILLTMSLIWGWRDGGVRRWVAGASAVIAVAGFLWAIVIWLPNSTAVAIDVKIWPPYQWNLAPGALARSIKDYLAGANDYLYGSMLLPLILLGGAGAVAILALRKRLRRPRQGLRRPRSPGPGLGSGSSCSSRTGPTATWSRSCPPLRSWLRSVCTWSWPGCTRGWQPVRPLTMPSGRRSPRRTMSLRSRPAAVGARPDAPCRACSWPPSSSPPRSPASSGTGAGRAERPMS